MHALFLRALLCKPLLLVFFVAHASGGVLSSTGAQDYDVYAHYKKSEFKIPMRDGVKLHTVVYEPKDSSQDYPILLVRTPYSSANYDIDKRRPARNLAPSEAFLRDGYIFVVQDGRGTFRSEGEWTNLWPVREDPDGVDETTDAYDTIDWLVNNIPGNNGRVGQWGISHPGWYTIQSIIDSPHPALKAVSPGATTFDAFIGDDEHRNGALDLLSIVWFYRMSVATNPDRAKLNGLWPDGIDYGEPWAYEFFLNAGPIDEYNERLFDGRLTHIWDNIIEHPNYDDFWRKLNVGRHLDNISVPVLNVAGWFDSPTSYGAIKTYGVIEEKNAQNKSTLVVGPWRHGGWHRDDGSRLGDIEFGANTSDYYNERIIFPFFQYYLKGKGQWSPAEAIVFETGSNEWRNFDQWPPKDVEMMPIYFHEGGVLSFERQNDRQKGAHDSYLSDPSRPVPFTMEIRSDKGDAYRVGDQRFAYTRPDVLTFQTAPLNRSVTIAGPILANLVASTTGTDSDWVVKLIDVYPHNAPDNVDGVKMAGYQMLVGAEVMRGKYRNSFSDPEPMIPGKPTPVSFEIRDKFHTFKKGHKIMVQVQSSWFPRIDRNPQTFTNIYRATEDEFQKATQKIYRSARYPSHIVLPTLK